MRYVNFLLAFMFVVFAFLQVNDPDPVVWILIYGAMAVVCILAAFEFYIRRTLIGLMVIYGMISIYYFPGLTEWLQHDDKAALFDNIAKMEHLYIEESREFLGLFICIGVLVMHLVRSKRYGAKNA